MKNSYVSTFQIGRITLCVSKFRIYEKRVGHLMPSVKVRNNNVNSALRVLKRKCTDHLWEVREKEFYTKPSEKRRKAKKAGIARARKKLEQERKKYDTKQF